MKTKPPPDKKKSALAGCNRTRAEHKEPTTKASPLTFKVSTNTKKSTSDELSTPDCEGDKLLFRATQPESQNQICNNKNIACSIGTGSMNSRHYLSLLEFFEDSPTGWENMPSSQDEQQLEARIRSY